MMVRPDRAQDRAASTEHDITSERVRRDAEPCDEDERRRGEKRVERTADTANYEGIAEIAPFAQQAQQPPEQGRLRLAIGVRPPALGDAPQHERSDTRASEGEEHEARAPTPPHLQVTANEWRQNRSYAQRHRNDRHGARRAHMTEHIAHDRTA